MIQLNTPYPATAYLTGFLRARTRRGVVAVQADPALELFLRLLSRDGLAAVRDELARKAARARRRRAPRAPASVACFLAEAERYLATVDAVVRFLQGRDPSLALRIAGRTFLPEGPRFAVLAKAAATRRPRRTTRRSPGPSARSGSSIAPSTSPASTSTISPTSSATASTRASSCRATARAGGERADLRRCARRSTAPPTLVDGCSTRSRAELRRRATRPISSG